MGGGTERREHKVQKMHLEKKMHEIQRAGNLKPRITCVSFAVKTARSLTFRLLWGRCPSATLKVSGQLTVSQRSAN